MFTKLVPLAFVALSAAPALAQARGDFHWEKALAAGSQVTIHDINGDVKVTPSTTGRVEIVGIKRGRNADRLRAAVQETSRGVVVCVLLDDSDSSCDDDGAHNRSRGHDWNDASMDLEVAVPANLTVSANTVSGDIDITGAQGQVSANSVSGDLKMQRLHASGVDANTVSGDIEVGIDEFTGRGTLSFHTVSGDVTLELPRQFDADISMSTVSGSMNSDFPMTVGNGRMSRRSIQARIGSGGRRLELNTVSGDVTLKSR